MATPLSDKHRAALVFLIDFTGSMGEWIKAVNETLPTLIRSVCMTDVFESIAIMGYSDYDLPVDKVCKFSGWCNTGDAKRITELCKFAAALRPEGGGGAPEAFKTGLLELCKVSKELKDIARVHILHLTDAPPHCSPNLDTEGKKEKAALGTKFDWQAVANSIKMALPTARYTALTTSPHALYCDLAHRTGGSAHRMAGGATAANIRAKMAGVMNGWLGLPDAVRDRSHIEPARTANHAEDALGNMTATITHDDAVPPACPVIKPLLSRALKRMRQDGPFREHIFTELEAILEQDPMSLTISPVIGKLWRDMSKSRDDPRRDALIERMSTRKNKLPPAEREAMDRWLKDSYDAKGEINGLLVDFMRANETRGLLRFVPEDEALCAQQVVQLLARNDKQSTALIRAILSRMLVDREASIAKMPPSGHAVATAAAVSAARAKHTDPKQVGAAATAPLTPMPQSLVEAPRHFRTALVLLLPSEVSAKVDTFRAGNDQAYPRWMPHITLAFPFLPPNVFADAIPAITAALATDAAAGLIPAAFDLALREIGWFPGGKAVLHLKPETKGTAPNGEHAIKALHDFVMRLFPQVAREDRSEFHAHVTLGQCAGQQAAKKAAAIKEAWTPAKFKVAQFHLIVHADDTEGYQIAHSFDLPKAVPEASAALGVRTASKAAAKPATKAVDEDDESADDDDVEPALQAGTLPLNLGVERFMELVMHTVAPGTRLSRRYAAVLAMHAILCGSVLAPIARTYLETVKGRWINWRRREDQTAEIPENFAGPFIALLLHKDVVDMLTPEEVEFARFVMKVATALKFYHSLEVTVQTIDRCSMDGKFPDHLMLCTTCNKERPLSLITPDGTCGYCKENRGETIPEADPTSQLQVRCHTCGAVYARNAAVRIQGNAKCHGCHRVGQPSPSAQCRLCNVKVVQYYNTDAGLPKKGVCGPCAAGCPPRKLELKDHVSLASQIMNGKAFLLLCRRVGLVPVVAADAATSSPPTAALNMQSMGAYDAVLKLQVAEPDLTVTAVDIEMAFREQRPENADAIFDHVIGIMSGSATVQRFECSVCLTDEERLFPACGRRGCEQRVCRGCLGEWFGKNAPGKKLYERALLCQFCARIPAPQVLRGVSARLLAIARLVHGRGEPLDPQVYHAWCEGCDRAAPLAPRDCAELAGQDFADLAAFHCETCVERAEAARRGHMTENSRGESTRYRDCPGCSVTTEKMYGCDHITCESCQAHWCWRCGEKFADADATYEHMWSAHENVEEDMGENDEE